MGGEGFGEVVGGGDGLGTLAPDLEALFGTGDFFDVGAGSGEV